LDTREREHTADLNLDYEGGHDMTRRSCLKSSRNRKLIVAVVVMLWAGGSGYISAQTDTELEAERTLKELRINLQVPAEPNVAVPDVYLTPPKISEQIVGGKPEWKLFYFCRYHRSDDLKKIIHEQFAVKLFEKPDKPPVAVPDYTVSSNQATNQLIVRCPAREDIDAVLETLDQVDVPPIQVKIDCLISEVYADLTFDRETTIEIENLLGESIAMKPGGLPFGSDVRQLIDEGGEVLPAFPGASMREVARSRMGLNIGYLSSSHAFTLLVDLLESRGYLKILMNPTLEVVNGGTAKVMSSQKVPIDRTTMRSTISDYLETQTQYEDVIDSLQVTAHVFGDGYIGLETSILLGSKNTPEGVKQLPIITRKQIDNKQNRIRQGESLIIGGIRKNEKFAVVRGVPVLKDIPIIGFLFSSEDTESRAVETIFILTPSISTNGRPREEVMSEVSRKHKAPSSSGLSETVKDPFGFKAREQAQQQAVEEAERTRLEAEAQKTQAQINVQQASERADKAEAEVGRLKTEADRIRNDAQKAAADAEAKAKAAREAQAAADKALAEAKKAQEAAGQAEAKAKAASAAPQETKQPQPGAEAQKPAAGAGSSKAPEPKETEKAKTEEPKTQG
jgi:type II secretory pathway component GspD/PulD (secretin)